jgi:natural product precursor
MKKLGKKKLHLNRVEVARLVPCLQEEELKDIKGGDPGVLMTTCVRVFCVETEN